MQLYKGFVCHPTVCCVGDKYQIMIPVKYDLLVSIKIGEKIYSNHSNGIRISGAKIQRIEVPMDVLNKEKKYTVLCRKMILRKAYSSLTGKETAIEYNFKPLNKTEDITIYHISDTHSHIAPAVEAFKKYEKNIDLLILNGDIAGTSENISEINVSYKIASAITGGTIPCIISRGNHDLRGKCAEKLADYMPNYHGKSYYTVKIGCIWALLIDTGEDKPDNHKEYGNTVACHQFREEETEFINSIVANKENEYKADDIKYRLIISHVPFVTRFPSPFDIEENTYREWCRILKVNIEPNLMICGHTHDSAICEVGDKFDDYGQPCTMLIGSTVRKNKKESKVYFAGMGLELSDKTATVTFNTKNEILLKKEINIYNYRRNLSPRILIPT